MKGTNYLTLILLVTLLFPGYKKQNPLIKNNNIQSTSISKYVMQILLNKTKTMLAIPGRTYDFFSTGLLQENWQMVHRSWLPWISVNHLHRITGLEEIDPALYQQLSK